MKLFRKIDTTTGNFIEDVLFESHPYATNTIQEPVTLEDGTTEMVSREAYILDGEGNPILDAQFVEEAPQQGFYLPRWNGTEWVEGGEPLPPSEPLPQEPTVDERLDSLEDVMLFVI